ncbi:UNVERIFIED_CONTAM: hypothetical protein FKN15_058478 [Acipenser sinensis]
MKGRIRNPDHEIEKMKGRIRNHDHEIEKMEGRIRNHDHEIEKMCNFHYQGFVDHHRAAQSEGRGSETQVVLTWYLPPTVPYRSVLGLA